MFSRSATRSRFARRHATTEESSQSGAAMSNADAIAALREALEHSPNNTPLRKHLASLLISGGRHEEAADVYKEGLTRQPDCTDFKVRSEERRVGKEWR